MTAARRAGVQLLRAGEGALSVDRIAEHGRQARAAASPLPATPTRLARRAERDRMRAELVAQARTELARHERASDTGDGSTIGVETVANTAYDRALSRARSVPRSVAARRGHRSR